MTDVTSTLTSNPNTFTGNAFVDAFLEHAGKSVRLDSWDEQWKEIETKFETWWATYQAWNYDDQDAKDEQREHDEALRVLRGSLHSVFEVERGCLMLPLQILGKYTGISAVRRKLTAWQQRERDGDEILGAHMAASENLSQKKPNGYDSGDSSLFS